MAENDMAEASEMSADIQLKGVRKGLKAGLKARAALKSVSFRDYVIQILEKHLEDTPLPQEDCDRME